MRWMIGAIAGIAILAVLAYALLVPPTSGPGWALDDTTPVSMPVMLDEPAVLLYATQAGDPLLVIHVYGSSSCPPRVRGVSVQDDAVQVRIGRTLLDTLGACTADAASHWFSIRVDRAGLTGPSFRVTVDAEDNAAIEDSFELPPEAA